MSATHRSSVFEDPLRETRLAVLGGRFQQGWNALRTLPAEVRGSPDGLLLGAMATWRLGEFERSRTAAIQARDGFRGRGDTDGEMRAENVAAAGAFALGDLTEAERGFNRALSLADDLADDLMIARCANNLGNVAYYLARTETALSFYRLAIANFEKLAFWSGLAEGWLNTAIVLHDAEDFAASREAGERAIAAAERSGDGRILGQALAARSETDIALGDLALAKVLAERALTLAQTHDHVVGEADARRVLAVLARHRGEPTVALDQAGQALEIARRVHDPWREAEILEEIGTIHATIGRTGDAIAAYDAAAHAFGTLGSDTRASAMRDRSAALPS